MSPQALADLVVRHFDPKGSQALENALLFALQKEGYSEGRAADVVESKITHAVFRELNHRPHQELPFDFSLNNKFRLVGKERKRKTDTVLTTAIRDSLNLIPQMRSAVYALGACDFERLTARMMRHSGALEAFAGCTNDDGGVDVYGRFPVRVDDRSIHEGLINTTLINKNLFFVCQCKCYGLSKNIDPEDIRSFRSAADSCLAKYVGNNKPPSHRVPEYYYLQRESVLRLFFTSAQFSSKAQGVAQEVDVVLVGSETIAQYLIYSQVAVQQNTAGELVVSQENLRDWAKS